MPMKKSALYICSFTALIIALLPLAAITLKAISSHSDAFDTLRQTILNDLILNSLALAGIVAIISLSIGVICAWIIVRYRFWGRGLIEWALILPLAFPAYILAYAYTDFLDVAGPVQSALRDFTGLNAKELFFPNIRSLGGAGFIIGLCLYPYIYLFARTAFLAGAQSQIDAARILGAGQFQQFFRVALPAARPYIATGLALVMMETLADYGTVSYFGVQVFSTGIYQAWAGYGDIAAASKLSLLLLIPVLILFMMERSSRARMKFYALEGSSANAPKVEISLRGLPQIIALIMCSMPIIFGFIIPMLILISLSLEGVTETTYTHIWDALQNTILFASITCVGGLSLALFFVTAKKHSSSVVFNHLITLLNYGYALSGVVLGIGLLIVSGWYKDIFGAGILSGSFLFLVLAYIIRFLAVPIQSLEAGFEKISDHISDAAKLLNQNAASRFYKITLPLLWSTILSAALILFVEIMKELPITLILRPFDFDTLAVKAYNFAMDERLSEAAFPALLIMCAGLIPVFIIARLIRSDRSK